MAHKCFARIIAIGALALTAAAVAVVVDSEPVSTIAGLIVLIIPGPVVAWAFVPARRQSSWTERFAWAIAAEFVLLIAVGLALSQSSDVTRRGWTIALTAATLFGLMAVSMTRPSASVAAEATTGRRVSWPVVGVAAACALMISAAVVVSVDSDRGVRTAPFTELWMVPSARSAVVLGVRSHERSAALYRVELTSGARKWRTWTVRLAPDRQWQVTVTPPATRLRCRLYIDGRATPYRTVDLDQGDRARPAGGTGGAR